MFLKAVYNRRIVARVNVDMRYCIEGTNEMIAVDNKEQRKSTICNFYSNVMSTVIFHVRGTREQQVTLRKKK